MKILLVHRQEEVFRQIKHILRDGNSYIRHFKSGLDGLLASRKDSYDMVIIGTDLPVITGYELARSIRHVSNQEEVSIVLIADVLNERTKYLGKGLSVRAILSPKELNHLLPGLVGDTILNFKYDINPSFPYSLN